MAGVFDFVDIALLLQESGAQISAAELHGLQTGLICGTQASLEIDWFLVMGSELDCKLSSEAKNALDQLYFATSKQMDSILFSFQPLLVSDDENIVLRALSLADWCHGFLSGLGLAGVTDKYLSSRITREAIGDISQIALVEVEPEEFAVQDEAYMRLVEYVRVAVYSIYIDLHGKNSRVHSEPMLAVKH